jgi:CRP/FNR family transcriptional regulator, cyclic AMP receptor protein
LLLGSTSGAGSWARSTGIWGYKVNASVTRNGGRDCRETASAHPNFFTTNNILAGLPTGFVSPLLASAPTVSLRAGKRLFEKGDAGDGCYWLQTGAVRISVSSDRGMDKVLAILGPGSILGELSMIDGLPRSADVGAVTNCQLSFISRPAFLERLQQRVDIYDYLLTTLSQRLRQADEELAAATFLSVRARLARALLQLAHHLGQTQKAGSGRIIIRHQIRQNDLASMAGVARESVSRTMSEWKDDQTVIQLSPFVYSIDVARLQVDARSTL